MLANELSGRRLFLLFFSHLLDKILPVAFLQRHQLLCKRRVGFIRRCLQRLRPSGVQQGLLERIDKNFGSYDKLKALIAETAKRTWMATAGHSGLSYQPAGKIELVRKNNPFCTEVRY